MNIDYEIKDSGERREFSTGAVRDCATGKGRNDLLPLNAIMDLAIHCEKGALKYGEGNVNKGIPGHCFFDSAMRHLMKYQLGWEDEDHLVAAAWNIMWLLEQRTTHPELDDRIMSQYEELKDLSHDVKGDCEDCVHYAQLADESVCSTCTFYHKHWEQKEIKDGES